MVSRKTAKVLLNHGSIATLAWAACLTATPALAQDALPDETSEVGDVIVTGVRAAIDRSLTIKREADSIVDGVSAEEMGKLGDTNIAEAIQRVPGVSIDRSGGEGRFVSINGLGPEFASVLVNGRSVANDNPDRSFSFDTIASELVSTVNVYKSANAAIPEGGVGGTIDVITARPFDYPGFKFAGTVGALYEENSGETTPQASFILSNRFADGSFGVLASFTHQERRNRTYAVQNSATIANLFFDPDAYAYVADDLDEAWRMQDLGRSVIDEHRTRTGGSVAVQWQPNDVLLFTADYLYSKFEVDTTVNSALNWFWAVLDTDKNVVDENGVYTTIDHAVGRDLAGYAYTLQEQYRPVETHMLGFNTRWTPLENFWGEFDVAWSTATNDNRGLDRDYTLEALNQPGFLVVTPDGGGVPYFEGPSLFIPSDTNVTQLRARINSNSGSYVESENWQAKADFKVDATQFLRVDFGASYNEARKQNEFWQTPMAIRRMYHQNATGQAIDTDSIVTGILRPGDVFGNPLLNGDMFLINGDALRAWMADPVNLANRTRNAAAGGLQEFIANGRSWDAVKSGDSYVITEEVFGAYVDLHFDTELFGRPLGFVAGVRFADTSLTSDGTSRILTDLYIAPGEVTGILTPEYSSTELEAVSVDNSYQNWLPSFNARYELTEDMLLRVAASQTLTRPILEELAPQITYGSMFAVARYARGSNPSLKPFLSTNFDVSWEWYYKPESGLSIAYFHKDIDDYIVSTVAEEVFDTVATPEYRTFQVTRPRNAEQAELEGMTFSWIHTFDMGAGFQANYTRVSGDVSSSSDPAVNFALPGLSDTANIVAFYESGPLAARVAFNWRDGFLAQPNYGGTTEPRYYEPYQQVDARISYAVRPGTVLALDAINLTEEKVLTHGRYDTQFISYQDYGRRFTVSLSTRF